jgi:hypothetical protein
MNMTIEEVEQLPLGNLECSQQIFLWGMDFKNPIHIDEAFEILQHANIQQPTSLRMLYDLAIDRGWVPILDKFYLTLK